MTHQDFDNDADFVQNAFAELSPIEASASLRRKVAQIPLEHAAGESVWWPFSKFWQPLVAMAAVAALGVISGKAWDVGAANEQAQLGTTLAVHPDATEDNETDEGPAVATTATEGEGDDTDETNDELEDLFTLAFATEDTDTDWTAALDEQPTESNVEVHQ